MKWITFAPSIVMDVVVIGVTSDRTGAMVRWVADVEATTYGGQSYFVKADGTSPEGAQMRALAIAVKAALPKPVLDELLALENEASA